MHGTLVTRIGTRIVPQRNITNPIMMLRNVFYKRPLYHNRLMRFRYTGRGLLPRPI
jgi:hypothetical protein